jgi:two-component system KDP operon response regulator KdpE
MNELLARVRAGLRRAASAAVEAESKDIAIGDFSISLETRLVTISGREVRLTPKEFDLLVYMARHANKVLTHRVLLGAVWGESSTEQPEYLRVFINHLRNKIEPDDGSTHYIITEPWVGYRFEPGE